MKCSVVQSHISSWKQKRSVPQMQKNARGFQVPLCSHLLIGPLVPAGRGLCPHTRLPCPVALALLQRDGQQTEQVSQAHTGTRRHHSSHTRKHLQTHVSLNK